MARVNRSVLWTDTGAKATITLLLADPTATGIMAALVAKSNADWVEYWEGPLTFGAPAPVSAQYPAVNQQAVLTFLCADGTIAKVALPAPQIGIFLPDGQTVDATQIVAIIAACVGTLTSNTGSLAASFLGGFLQGRG